MKPTEDPPAAFDATPRVIGVGIGVATLVIVALCAPGSDPAAVDRDWAGAASAAIVLLAGLAAESILNAPVAARVMPATASRIATATLVAASILALSIPYYRSLGLAFPWTRGFDWRDALVGTGIELAETVIVVAVAVTARRYRTKRKA
jgi:hypothetical protein